MAIWTLSKKDFLLLLRDRRATLLLLVMPLLFILVLGLLLGEAFGQKPDDRIRIMFVNLDRGPVDPSVETDVIKTWADAVQEDLRETAGIRIERIESEEEAHRLVAQHKQAAVLILKPNFSEKINRCSFLTDGINPFHRDGVLLDKIDAELLRDTKQPGQGAIIDQVSQVTLLRVILPYMIGKAFKKLSDPKFIEILGSNVSLPLPFVGKKSLNEALKLAAGEDPKKLNEFRDKVGDGVQKAIQEQFANYELTGMTWAKLTRAKDPRLGEGAEVTPYTNKDGNGVLHRGAARYQLLVPSYTVMFAFFLVMTVGWVFVAERRQGTLKRLRAAPLTRGQILLGKLLPCFALSLLQGVFLLICGKLVFGMRWGPESWALWEQALWLLPVVFATSLAAMGLALLVAALARSEIQVALYGAVPVLVLALIGGCVLPRELMPEQTQQFTLWTPHGWALDAYRELLDPDPKAIPNLQIVTTACAVLTAFGAGFVALAWWLLPLE